MQLFMVQRLKIIEIQVQKAIFYETYVLKVFLFFYNVRNNTHARHILRTKL